MDIHRFRGRRFGAGLVAIIPFLTHAASLTGTVTRLPDYPKQAIAHEQAGDKVKAAEIYEKIVAQDPTKRFVLAPRLVRLYAESGVTNKALEWAEAVMKTNPDPQAYLAGVQAMLGDWTAARALLEQEIQKSGEARRKLTLLWQLADVLDRQGDRAEARKRLETAVAMAQGTPDEPAARARLEQYRRGPRAP